MIPAHPSLVTAPEPIRGRDQRADVSGLGYGMSGVGRDMQLGLWPDAVQFPRAHHRTHHVVPTLNDHPRKVANGADIFDQVIVGLKETIVHEVMAFDARQRQSPFRLSEFIDQLLIGKEFGRAAFSRR